MYHHADHRIISHIKLCVLAYFIVRYVEVKTGQSWEQIAERIAAYRKRGVDLVLGGFLHFQEEIEYFGARVLPLVREIEAAEQGSFGAPVLASA